MKVLAQWAMASRKQATVAAAICLALPMLFWLGSALLALVVLRHGQREGMLVGLWALLPAIAWFAVGDFTPFFTALGAFVLALSLRQNIRLDWAVMLSSLLGVALYWLLPVLAPDTITLLVDMGSKALKEAMAEQTALLAQLEPLLAPMLIGVIAALHSLACILSLLLARYWQSELYNPAGFGQEFRQLRLPLAFSLPTLLLLLATSSIPSSWVGILPALTVSMVLAAVALLHFVVKHKQAGTQWLVLFYATLVFFGPYIYTLLIFVAVLDSALHLRSRLKDTA